MAQQPVKILIVDDEEDITIAIGDYFNRHDFGIQPITTNDPRMVFPLLSEHEDIALVLSDFRMPAINGLDLLLRVKSQYPQIKFIIMTGYGSPELRKEGLKRGAVRYIEKPFDIAHLAKIVQESLKDKESAGFGGTIESFNLEDIIQLIGLSQRTVSLKITANQGKGVCHFVDGEIIGAECNNLTGEEAFYEIFRWTGGQFSLEPPESDPEHNIAQSWQGLLLEAARRKDEEQARQDNVFDGDADEEEAPAAEPEPAPEPEPEPEPEPDPEPEPESQIIGGKVEDLPEGLTVVTDDDQAEDSDFITPEEVMEEVLGVPDSELGDDNTSDRRNFDMFSLVSDTDIKENDTGSAPAAVPPAETADNSDKPITEQMLGSLLDRAVKVYLGYWPKGKNEVPFSSLPLSKLSVNVRRHLFFRFHRLSMQVIRTEGVPFDFSNDKVVAAVRNLLQVLREHWMVTKPDFERMIREAMRFDLARSIDPAKAIAQLFRESTGGKAVQMLSLLRALIEHELVDPFFETLLEDLQRQSGTIHPRKVENFARAILDRRDEDESYQAIRESMLRIFEVAGMGNPAPPRYLHSSLLVKMLDARGLAHIADAIRDHSEQPALTVEDLDSIMTEYR
ncbi:DUF4388 domain-containing protein [bacterium]|nr:DUF4388 domain-containing protein [bacterium]